MSNGVNAAYAHDHQMKAAVENAVRLLVKEYGKTFKISNPFEKNGIVWDRKYNEGDANFDPATHVITIGPSAFAGPLGRTRSLEFMAGCIFHEYVHANQHAGTIGFGCWYEGDGTNTPGSLLNEVEAWEKTIAWYNRVGANAGDIESARYTLDNVYLGALQGRWSRAAKEGDFCPDIPADALW